MSWNHSTEYKLPEFQTIGAGAGIGGFEKVYDTSALPYHIVYQPLIFAVATFHWHINHLHSAKGARGAEQAFVRLCPLSTASLAELHTWAQEQQCTSSTTVVARAPMSCSLTAVKSWTQTDSPYPAQLIWQGVHF